MEAVITADIVNSTKLEPNAFSELERGIRKLYSPFRLLFYRGDSYQVLVPEGHSAYRYMLLSRLMAITHSNEVRIDIRQSISIGNVSKDIMDMGSHVDPVFVNSGRSFDKFTDVESGRLLLMSCGDDLFDMNFELIARYTDSLLSQVTAKQARALYELFLGKTQKETAALLGKTGATINQQVKAARLEELELLLSKYEELIQIVEKHGV